ncbi:hypothetical protein GGX14DRAFT_556260 [Mycena pura]|uniref:Uncharacterized protein n=1 Tax=Mycena pura TaxID=153505 RepID=A0AAD6YPA3_9AGAR|nr:hypothetical protein GGX14DRAFT_556260 [Mycena pura]
MFIPESPTYIREECKPNGLDCIGTVVPGESSSTDMGDVEQNTGQVYSSHGIHNFIGILLVVTLILLAFLLWLGLRWRRRKLRAVSQSRAMCGSPKSEVGGSAEDDSNRHPDNTLVPRKDVALPAPTERRKWELSRHILTKKVAMEVTHKQWYIFEFRTHENT